MENSSDPFTLLASANATDRLRGARALLGAASDADLPKLRAMRANEVDSWVQATLERVIRSATRAAPTRDEMGGSGPEVSAQLADDINAQAIQYVSMVMLHELRPLVSRVIRSTREMVGGDYDGSPASAAIDRLKDFLSTMERFHTAAAAPNVTQFDLVALLVEQVDAAGYGSPEVSISRNDALVVHGDPELLGLAVQNCLRNAVEASIQGDRPTVINCGSNQKETWVAILDEGVGLPDDKDKLLEAGNSMKSKDEHFGMGLAIAERAMKSFDGFITLTPRDPRGTCCELRWPNPQGPA